MSDQDWKIMLPFSVPPGDTDGVLTEAIFDAGLYHAPSKAEGMVASADTDAGKVWLVFTLVDTSRDFADEIAQAMIEHVRETVFSGDDACVSAA